MKIDLVYLWVDGNDPKWLARKNAFLGNVVVPEHFLFSNDDMFFNANVLPDFFFAKDGYPTIENHIRSPKDIQRIIYSYYALAVKHAHLRYVGYLGRKESCVIGVCKTDYEHYFKCYKIKLLFSAQKFSQKLFL
jgi:hypothetical protein